MPFHVRVNSPPFFSPGLLIAVCISLVVASLTALTLPVWIGRRVMALWLVGAPPPSPPVAMPLASTSSGEDVPTRVHELYTAACGNSQHFFEISPV